MVSDTRSVQKSKDEVDSHTPKKKINIRKDLSTPSSEIADVSGVRRSAREKSLPRQTTPSPQNVLKSKETKFLRQTTPSPQSTRKSKRLELEIPPSSPHVNRKSERLKKFNTRKPSTRSNKKRLSSGSLGSKKLAKDIGLSKLKRKKANALIQETMESEKTEHNLEPVSMKRKKMSSQTFKALFKRQRIAEFVTDGDGEREGLDKLSYGCSDNSRTIGSEPMRKEEDEDIDKVSDGALQKSMFNLKGCHADKKIDINVYSSLGENVVDEPCPIYSQTSSSVVEMLAYSERLPTNCASTENRDGPESESSTCFVRSRDGSVSSESPEKFVHQKGPMPLPEIKCDYRNLLGTCVLCSKNRRVGYDSPEQELCSCSLTVDEDLCHFSTCKDRNDRGAAVNSEFAEKDIMMEMNADSQISHENFCALCNKDGELLCCVGNGCKRCCHLLCLDPSITDALPGAWHCPDCVKKKLLFGVHSVSGGVESIWDVREVEVSNATGVRQRQYLVKYNGLAHIHNHWVPEKQLLLENPNLVSNYIESNQLVSWCIEWTMPHRLLRKRPIQDKIYIASDTVISVCNYEWLVKWHGLSYEHATWELDNTHFLSSSLGYKLMKDYEIRRQKACGEINKQQKGSIVKFSELPDGRSHVNDNMLKNVNKLCECLVKSQNAVVFDDQERARATILLIQSVIERCWPFLIVTTSSSLYQWEAEFAELFPSVDIVVYGGNRNSRDGIRVSEFYEEGGCMMLQVLLTSIEVVLEDLDILRSIRWEAIVIDECQHSWTSSDIEQIKMLSTDSRILLVSGQIKETASEYLKMLSLLESHDDFDKLKGLKSDTNENLCKLRDRLSCFIVHGSNAQVSKFVEYWVPAEISNYQLELYCATLLSNSIPLRSCLRSDPVGALQDVLHTVRKCCDHPYLLDSSVQELLIAEQRPASDLLDVGIKASGKLQFLDMMLTEAKIRGLKVLVLFQLINGSAGASNGDILDDFLRQRFGENAYERIEAGVTSSRKQAAVNRFNKKETGQFVFLLENRACTSRIKFSSLDVVVIFGSDWNPANDLRALQKISIDSEAEQIKVFRLYSCFTVEERALVLAKQNLNLDNSLQTLNRTTSDSLLSWGATNLFRKLDEYHADSNSTSALTFSPGQWLLDEVTKEFQAIVSRSCDNTDSNSVVSKVKLGVTSYSSDIPMLGESKVQLKDKEEPHAFWRNLLDGKNPQWKHLSSPRLRNRKRVCYLGASPSKSKTEKDDVAKKCKKMVNNLDPASVQVQLETNQGNKVAVSKGGLFKTKASKLSPNLHKDITTVNSDLSCVSGKRSFNAEFSVRVPEKRTVSDEQESLHSFLQDQMTRLCKILKLSGDVTRIVRRFLEYVVKNHHVNSDSSSIVQAFQVSLCWIAASIAKQKVDKKGLLMLAKQFLNYQCTEEQVNSVYSKMRPLKRLYLQSSENSIDLGIRCFLAEADNSQDPSNVGQGSRQFSSHTQMNIKTKIGEKSGDEENAEGQTLVQNKLALKDKGAASEIDNKIKKIQRKCDKRKKKLIQRQQMEIEEFQQIWEEKRVKLETDHKLESTFIRSIHGQGSLGMNKLKLLNDNFAEKIKEHNLLKDMQLKDLEAKQLAAVNEERQKADHWLAMAKVCTSERRAVDGPESLGSHSEHDARRLQSSTCINTVHPREVLPTSGHHLEDQNPNKSFGTRESDALPSITSSISAPAEAISCETPVENLTTVNSQNEVGAFDGNQRADVSEEFPKEMPKSDSNEVAGHAGPSELSEASNKESNKGREVVLPVALVSQRDRPDEAAGGDLQNPGQLLLAHSEEQLDKSSQSLASVDLENLDAAAIENQRSLHVEVTAMELNDTAAARPPNHEVAVNDETVAPPPPIEAQVAENSELHCVSVDVSLSCNESPAIEDHDHGRSSPTAEFERIDMLSREAISDNGENLETHCNVLDIGPRASADRGQSVELYTAPQNNEAMPPAGVSTAEQINQAVLPLGMDAGHGPSYPVHPTNQPPQNPTPSLLADPLQTELEKMHKETEKLDKNQEDMMSLLKSECEKEIQEIIAQIRNKYELKLQETEAEYRLKRNELDMKKNKVLMNKILAQAFRSKCLDLRPSMIPGMQQGVPSGFMQHLHQVLSPPSVRPCPVASACRPAPTQQVTTPVVQTMQLSPRPYPARLPPVSGQSVTAPPVQVVQHAAALFSGTSSRPPIISAISPSVNPRGGGAIRSPAPHLQPFRPRASIATSTSSSVSQLRHQQVLHSQPMRPPPPPVQPLPSALQLPLTNLVSQDWQPELQDGVPARPSTSLSTPGLGMDMDHWPSVTGNYTSSPLPEIGSTFHSLELSYFGILDHVQGNQESAVATNVVCLSDDD